MLRQSCVSWLVIESSSPDKHNFSGISYTASNCNITSVGKCTSWKISDVALKQHYHFNSIGCVLAKSTSNLMWSVLGTPTSSSSFPQCHGVRQIPLHQQAKRPYWLTWVWCQMHTYLINKYYYFISETIFIVILYSTDAHASGEVPNSMSQFQHSKLPWLGVPKGRVDGGPQNPLGSTVFTSVFTAR